MDKRRAMINGEEEKFIVRDMLLLLLNNSSTDWYQFLFFQKPIVFGFQVVVVMCDEAEKKLP